MVISFASGKGGTGKTTVATNVALALQETAQHTITFLDCDVEEPNAAIFLKPTLTQRTSVGIPVPQVDFNKCTYCGKCAEVCAYNAIAVINPVKDTEKDNKMTTNTALDNAAHRAKKSVLIFPELCHGCGGCSLFCPEHAITETHREVGIIERGHAGTIAFVQGMLNVGEPMATPIIREMKREIINDREERRNGETEKSDNGNITIIDVPPGTSCPVIEAVKGSTFTVLVTEPTPFGLNDLVLAVETMRTLAIPCGVIINRHGIGDTSIESYCEQENIPVLLRIPMDREIAVAYSKGIPLVEINTHYRTQFRDVVDTISQLVTKT
jgi:MinD superfamily P-loop ATPase